MSVTGAHDLAVAATIAGCIALPLALLAVSTPGPAAARLATTPAAAVAPAAPPCTAAPVAVRAGALLFVGLPGVLTADEPLAREVLDVGVSGIFLAASNVRSGAQVTALTTALKAAAHRPLLVATDAESGRVSVLRGVVGAGPSPRRLARQRTPAQTRTFAADLGARLHGLGVDLDLAPVLDLDDGPYDGVIGDRSFAADPDTVTTYATAFRAGLSDAGVLSAVKHFPGQGRSGADPHRRPATVDASVADLLANDVRPFRSLVTAGAPVVMMNHLDYAALDHGLPASLSPAAYVLLRSLGFDGVAMTDSLGMGAVNTRWDFPEAAVRAIAAGADVAFATDGHQAVRMRDALLTAVRSGRLSQARLDDAVDHVTRLTGGAPLTCTG